MELASKTLISRNTDVLLCLLVDHSGLVSSDATRGLRVSDVTQENRRVQMTAIWSDTAMN